MDIATGLGLLAGFAVVCTLILLGGDFRMFYDMHALIVIFGGSFSATLIRFPLGAIFHGLPLGAKFAFTLRRQTQLELIEQIAGIAETARKQGRVIADPPAIARVKQLSDSGVDLELTVWISDPALGEGDLRSDLLKDLLKAYRMAGIEIPYPRREVRLIATAETGENPSLPRA